MWVDLIPVTADVEPGAEAEVEITVRNTGDIVEEYHLQATGDPGRWCSIEPQTLRLYPGTTGTATATFAPPRSSEAQAGPQSYSIKVTPREDRENTFAIEGVLRVAEFADLRAELLPSTAKGWHRGRVRLAVDNYSNTVTSASVSTTSTNSTLQVDIRTPALRLQPGRAIFSKFSVRPGRLLWFGTKARHQYNLTITPSGLGQPISLQGTYLQSALLPRWLQRLLMFFAAAAAAILALWFGIHPSFASTTQTAPQPSATAPTVIVIQPTPPPSSPSPTPTPKPTPTPTQSQAAPPPSASSSKSAPPPPASTSKPAPPPPASTSSTPKPPTPPAQIQTNNILNKSTNGSFDVNMDQFNDGQPIGIWETNHTKAQSWTVWWYTDGSVVIQSTDKDSSAGTKVLQVDPKNATDVDISDDWNGVDGLQAHLTADFQQWTLTSIPNNDTYGVLKNKHTNTCVASTGMHGFLTMAPCNTGDQNQWFWLFGP